jgi:hypothetical protein
LQAARSRSEAFIAVHPQLEAPTMKHAFAALALVAASAAALSPASAQSFSYPDFSSTTGLQLNGNAHQNGSKLTLTDATDGQSGSAWSTQLVHLGDHASFSSVFQFEILDHGGLPGWGIDGADGLTFTLQNNSNSVGSSGGGIGYYGIPKSVTVEFDTYQNGEWGDPSSNHVGINTNGSLFSHVTRNEGTLFDDGNLWWAWIDYNGASGNLAVRWAQSASRPDDAMLSYDLNIAAILGGDGPPVSDAYVGFTSATGAGWGQHNILSWNFEDSFDPNGAPLPTTTPEPGSLVLMVTGIGAMGLVRRKFFKS